MEVVHEAAGLAVGKGLNSHIKLRDWKSLYHSEAQLFYEYKLILLKLSGRSKKARKVITQWCHDSLRQNGISYSSADKVLLGGEYSKYIEAVKLNNGWV